MSKKKRFYFGATIASVVLLGCVHEPQMADRSSGHDAVNQETPYQTEPAPVLEPSYGFYSPVGKRDPFANYLDSLTPDEELQPRTKLERYDLEQLRLVAVATSMAAPRALVEDPEGEGHVVMKGTRIGRNQGRVEFIRGDEIIVREERRTWATPLVFRVPLRLTADETHGARGTITRDRRTQIRR